MKRLILLSRWEELEVVKEAVLLVLSIDLVLLVIYIKLAKS